MSSRDEGSITRAFDELRAGDPDAARLLWERYFQRLVGLAHGKLKAAHRPGAYHGAEDAALSAFESFCTAASRGRFPQLNDRDSLEGLLITITTQKACDQLAREGRQKRGGGRGAADCAALDFEADTGPTPELAAIQAEECRVLLDLLGDETLRRIVLLKLEGHTNEEVAAFLGCARRTVQYKIDLIKAKWAEYESRDPS